MSEKCTKCGGDLGKYGAGASKKFINRGTRDYYCLDCLAEMFKVERSFIEKKIEYFKSQGCTLFPD